MKKLISILSLFCVASCFTTASTSNLVNKADSNKQKEQSMKEVYDFLKKCGVYFLATVDGNQPRVRPFGTAVIFENKLYIQTGKRKEVSKQMKVNPKVEICALDMQAGKWIRIEATVVEDDRLEAKQYMLDQYPELKSRYSADDGNTQVLYLKDVTATFSSYTEEPKVVKF